MAFPGRNDPARRNARFEREIDNPFTRPQTARASFHPPDGNQSRPRTKSQAARATFPRTQALSISTARPRQHSQHFEHQAFPTSPTRPQAARRRHARQAASRIPNSMSTKPPMPLPPGLLHFPEKAAALFHVEGKTRERRRVRNASPAGKGARHGRANIRMQQLLRSFQQGTHHRGAVDPMPPLRRQSISVLGAPPVPRRLVGIEREARPRDNATVLYPPAKAALVFQKD